MVVKRASLYLNIGTINVLFQMQTISYKFWKIVANVYTTYLFPAISRLLYS